VRYLQLTVVRCKRNNWVERKIGGQPGHVKHERPPFTPEQIDRIVRHDQKPYAALVPLNQWTVLQQIELAKCPCLITEHRARCFCDRACLLCSEPAAEHCHRRLVAEYLQRKWGNVVIEHL